MVGREKEVDDIEIMKLFVYSRDPVLTADEVAEAVDMSQQGAFKRLTELSEDGLVASKKPNRDRVWWLTEKGQDELASRA